MLVGLGEVVELARSFRPDILQDARGRCRHLGRAGRELLAKLPPQPELA